MAEMGKAFDPEAFAIFAHLELRHVQAIIQTLTDRDMLPAKRQKAATQKQTSRITREWAMPAEWLSYGPEKRFWSPSDTQAEAEAFKGHFVAAGTRYVDWEMAWQGWVRRSRRPDGTHGPSIGIVIDPLESLNRRIALYDKMGRTTEAKEARRQLEKLSGNVVPFRLVG